MWSREYPPLVPFFRFLTIAKSVNQNGVNNQPSVTSDDTSTSEEAQTIFKLADLPQNTWYSSPEHRSGSVLGLPYVSQSDTLKGTFDSLGGSEVHGFKRSVDNYGFDRRKTQREYLNKPGIKTVVRHAYGSRSRTRRDVVEVTKSLSHHSTLDAEGAHGLQKRSLDSLGGYQVHGWKRGLDSLGGYQVHGWKRGLDSLGGYQVRGWKRGLDSLGGYQVHGWKRGLDNLDGLKNQGLKQDSEKGSLDPLGGFHVHLLKKRFTRFINGNQDISSAQNTKSKETGSLNPSDRAWDSDSEIQGQKRGLHALGDYQVLGWKRDEEKRGLDYLGGYQVYGWKQDEKKRRLYLLGGNQVRGWKRDEEKRGLGSMGGYQIHGWKRDKEKRVFDSISGPRALDGGFGDGSEFRGTRVRPSARTEC